MTQTIVNLRSRNKKVIWDDKCFKLDKYPNSITTAVALAATCKS